MNQPKIRPPSPKNIRDEGESGLSDLVRHGPAVEADEGAVDANQLEQRVTFGAGNPSAFSPDEMVQLRREMNEPNRLGNPRRDTEAEKLLKRYEAALAEYRADYAGTRSEAKRQPYLEAREAMINAGLLQGEP